jgi:hypothetical protein
MHRCNAHSICMTCHIRDVHINHNVQTSI